MAKNKKLLKDLLKPVTTETPVIDFLQGLTVYQKQFILDPSTRKAAITSRQAGKTEACIRYLLKTAYETPSSISLFIGLSIAAVRRGFWRRLKTEARKMGMSFEPNITEFSLTLPNESVIYVSGADNADDIERFRGMTCNLIIMDECGSFGEHIRELVEEVLEPTLMIYSGSLCLTGTPKSRCAGLFFDATTKAPGNEFWSIHRWQTIDNPLFSNKKNYLEELKAKHGWTDETPKYRREYQGEWIPSNEELVYDYSPFKNAWNGQLPKGDLTYCAGIDFGYRDKTVITVACYSNSSPNLYIIYSEGWEKLDITGIVSKVEKVKSLYPKIYTWIADTGGLGKTITEELLRRHHLHIIPAVKTEKMAFIALMNDDLRQGKIKTTPNTALTQEWSTLILAEDGNEDQTQHNDYCDSALYAYRFARNYMFRPKEKELTQEQQEERLFEMYANELRKKQQIEKETLGNLFTDTNPF
jgi:hypothetical protein